MAKAATSLPRQVGLKEFEALQAATARLSIANDEVRCQIAIRKAEMLNLAAAGHLDEAEALGAKYLAELKLKYIAIGVSFEQAVVSFFGERRGLLETLDQYQQRIGLAVESPYAMLATQLKNGIVFKP